MFFDLESDVGAPSRWNTLYRAANPQMVGVKLVGCLEDFALDRVLADVKSTKTFSVTGF